MAVELLAMFIIKLWHWTFPTLTSVAKVHAQLLLGSFLGSYKHRNQVYCKGAPLPYWRFPECVWNWLV